MTLRPTTAVREWFQARGYLPDDDRGETWEYVYGHSSGYGYVTIRFWPNDYGYDLIVLSGTGDYRPGVNLGTCATLEQMRAADLLLRQFERARYVDAQGQRAALREPLTERA